MEPLFFHVDMDAFYAAVEVLDNPALRGQPIIVGGTSSRGVVSSCSYEARAFGIHAAMPAYQAKQLCPQGIFVKGRMERYSQVSHQIYQILCRFSPEVQQISIDEAFLDMSGTERLFGKPKEAAAKLKQTVLHESGLTISVGIGSSRYIAKLASAWGKPDGLCLIEKGHEQEFIDTLGLKKLWGIGDVAYRSLLSYGITTTELLRRWTLEQLQKTFGNSAGQFYWTIARGNDPGIYATETKSRSISTEMTFSNDISQISVLRTHLLRMSHEVMFRALEEQLFSSTVALKFRYTDFSTFSAHKTIAQPLYSGEEVYKIATELLVQKWKRRPLRLLGVGLHNVQEESTIIQAELFDDQYRRKRELEKVVLDLRNKGRFIEKATTLLDE